MSYTFTFTWTFQILTHGLDVGFQGILRVDGVGHAYVGRVQSMCMEYAKHAYGMCKACVCCVQIMRRACAMHALGVCTAWPGWPSWTVTLGCSRITQECHKSDIGVSRTEWTFDLGRSHRSDIGVT